MPLRATNRRVASSSITMRLLAGAASLVAQTTILTAQEPLTSSSSSEKPSSAPGEVAALLPPPVESIPPSLLTSDSWSMPSETVPAEVVEQAASEAVNLTGAEADRVTDLLSQPELGEESGLVPGLTDLESRLRSQSAQTSQYLLRASNALTDRNSRITELTHALKKAGSGLQVLRLQLVELQQVNSSMKARLAKSDVVREDLTHQLERATHELMETSSRLAGSQQQLALLQQAHDGLQSENTQLRDQLSTAQETNMTLASKMVTVQQQLAETTERLASVEQEFARAQAEREQLMADNAQLKHRLTFAEQTAAELAATKQHLAEAARELGSLEKALLQTRHDRAEYQAQSALLDHQLGIAQETNAALIAKVIAAQQQLSDAESGIQRVEGALTNLDAAQAQVSELRERDEMQTKQMVWLTQRLASISEEKQQLESHLQSLQREEPVAPYGAYPAKPAARRLPVAPASMRQPSVYPPVAQPAALARPSASRRRGTSDEWAELDTIKVRIQEARQDIADFLQEFDETR